MGGGVRGVTSLVSCVFMCGTISTTCLLFRMKSSPHNKHHRVSCILPTRHLQYGAHFASRTANVKGASSLKRWCLWCFAQTIYTNFDAASLDMDQLVSKPCLSCCTTGDHCHVMSSHAMCTLRETRRKLSVHPN